MPSTWYLSKFQHYIWIFDILMGCDRQCRVLEWGPHPRDYKTLAPRCKSETYSILFNAINLISCPNFSIAYQFLTHLWGIIGSGGYLSEGHTQGITRFYHLDVSLRPILYCLVPSTWFPVQISALHMYFWHTYGVFYSLEGTWVRATPKGLQDFST